MEAAGASELTRDELLRTMSGARKVILRKHYGEVHAYLLSVGEREARVVWMSASGKIRRRDVEFAALSLPDESHPWRGVEIPWAGQDYERDRRNRRPHRPARSA